MPRKGATAPGLRLYFHEHTRWNHQAIERLDRPRRGLENIYNPLMGADFKLFPALFVNVRRAQNSKTFNPCRNRNRPQNLGRRALRMIDNFLSRYIQGPMIVGFQPDANAFMMWSRCHVLFIQSVYNIPCNAALICSAAPGRRCHFRQAETEIIPKRVILSTHTKPDLNPRLGEPVQEDINPHRRKVEAPSRRLRILRMPEAARTPLALNDAKNAATASSNVKLKTGHHLHGKTPVTSRRLAKPFDQLNGEGHANKRCQIPADLAERRPTEGPLMGSHLQRFLPRPDVTPPDKQA